MSEQTDSAFFLPSGNPIPPELWHISDDELDAILRESRARTEFVIANPVLYPPKEIATEFLLTQESTVNGLILEFKREKAKGWRLSPQDVRERLLSKLEGLRVASEENPIAIGTWNLEMLTRVKAEFFGDALVEAVIRHHVLYLQEVSQEGVTYLASYSGYKGYFSVENNRHQGLGFLVHPKRIQILRDPISYDSVAAVKGIPDLRPVFRLDVRDGETGVEWGNSTLHAKSMKGGVLRTKPIRFRQNLLTVQELGPDYTGFVGGDFNLFLGESEETLPFEDAGYSRVHPEVNVATQAMGGVLDGFYHRGMDAHIGQYQVRAWFKEPMMRPFTDHALVTHTFRCAPKYCLDE
jgi:hypothetical protein